LGQWKGNLVADHAASNLPLYFVSALPRSGSTLLMNLLGQNSAHHVTPTSGLIELFVAIKNQWRGLLEFRAEGLDKVEPRIRGALRGLLYGFFDDEFIAGKTIFDKSRGWLQYIEPLEQVLERPVKIVVPVRDVRAIVASFEKIYRRRGLEYPEPRQAAFFQCQTSEGRARALLAPQSILGLTINRLRDALQRGVSDRLVIVPYRALTHAPQATLSLLHRSLGLPPFDYSPDDVAQITHEDDCVHGMTLHTIRTKVEPFAGVPWSDVLPDETCHWLERDYADINRLAAWQPTMTRPTLKRESAQVGQLLLEEGCMNGQDVPRADQ
jgi:sulfotransferase